MALQAITVRPYFRRPAPTVGLPAMPIEVATTRLTPREKEVLRAWLDHKSAKEIALELGITHHAVEKRLKMARTKLGAASSLEAARMLAAAEGYGQTVTAPPDLSPGPLPRSTLLHRPLVIGGIAMSLALVLALVLAPNSALAPNAELAAAAAPSADAATAEIEIDGDLGKVFAHLDENKSGFLESPESPFVDIAFLDDSSGKRVDGVATIGDGSDPDQVAEFYAVADTDRDGRISLAEYTVWSEARWGELGIEIRTIMKVIPAPES